MARRQVAPRAVRAMVLVVGEGYAEVTFLRHVRTLYTADNAARGLKLHNARGKGAGHVVDCAIHRPLTGCVAEPANLPGCPQSPPAATA